jgi:hypothetical protein
MKTLKLVASRVTPWMAEGQIISPETTPTARGQASLNPPVSAFGGDRQPDWTSDHEKDQETSCIKSKIERRYTHNCIFMAER